MSDARVLVSIDPGIDRAAAAFWTPVAPASADLGALATRLALVRECVTQPDTALGDRMAQLTSWAGLLVEDVRRLLAIENLVAVGTRAQVVVEWPAFAGMYRGRTAQRSKFTQPNAPDMAKLYAATGAIVAGCSRWCAQTATAPASNTPRETKQLLGRRAIEQAQVERPDRLPNNDDARSAVYVGLQALSAGPVA